MRAWQDAGLDGLVVAVNLSPVQLRRGEVDAVVAQALQATPPKAAASAVARIVFFIASPRSG